MKKIESIVFTREVEDNPDFSFLGEFSNIKDKFAVKTGKGNGFYQYFNADNVENIKQAKQNLKRMMEFEDDKVSMLCIKAIANIKTSESGAYWLVSKITSGGLYGIESDNEESYLKEIEGEQFEELKDVLIELGFTNGEIDKAKEGGK